MALRLVLIEDTDDRFNNPAPHIPAGVDGFELGLMVDFYDSCLAKYLEKAPQYGKAWQEQGAMGNLARIRSKVSRLKHMYWFKSKEEIAKDPQEITGQLEDSLLDIPNLCAFMRHNAWHGNSHGE